MTWTPRLRRRYADVIRAGSLADALDAEFARTDCSLRSSPTFFGVESVSFASVTSGRRTAQVLMGFRTGEFGLSLWEDQRELATGFAPKLSDAAGAIRLVLENPDRKISGIVAEIPFLKLKDMALSHERGTYIEDTWQKLLAKPFDRTGNELFHWDELHELIQLAAERPELRRSLPYTTLHRFTVTRWSRPPDNRIPVIAALGEGRYVLTPYFGGEALAEGTASLVLDALVEHVLKAYG